MLMFYKILLLFQASLFGLELLEFGQFIIYVSGRDVRI
jgi:hypothetical protein